MKVGRDCATPAAGYATHKIDNPKNATTEIACPHVVRLFGAGFLRHPYDMM